MVAMGTTTVAQVFLAPSTFINTHQARRPPARRSSAVPAARREAFWQTVLLDKAHRELARKAEADVQQARVP